MKPMICSWLKPTWFQFFRASPRYATGFNRNHRANTEDGIIPEEYAVEYVVDRVETTSTVFLGLTLPVERTRRTGASGALVLGEAPAGEPQPIKAWFPDGSLHGEAFLYR